MIPLKTAIPLIIARRIDVPGPQLGFSAPPCAMNLKFFELPSGWALIALTPPGRPPAAARWLEAYGPKAIQILPGLAPKVLRATFDTLPPLWEKLLTSVVVHYLELTPEGSASVFIEDSPEKVERFVQAVQASDPTARSRRSHAGPKRVKLTARQLEVLSLAVALGYYETPHKVNLRALAAKLGLSVGAVSELLRRGESHIITNYIDALSESRWDGTEPAAPGAGMNASQTL